MKKIIIALAIALTGSQIVSCQTGSSVKGGKLTADEFEQKINSQKDVQLIDVRTPEEYAGGFINGAQNIDWNGNSFDAEINKLNRNKAVFIYCLSGGRSAAAASRLRELDFKEVFDLKGGFMSWNNSGKPITATNPVTKIPGMSLAEYDQKINSGGLVLVDFNAPWCAPCKKMAPMLEELELENKNKLVLLKINLDENRDLARSLNISELPVLILYKNGTKVFEKTGLTEKSELLNVINKN